MKAVSHLPSALRVGLVPAARAGLQEEVLLLCIRACLKQGEP